MVKHNNVLPNAHFHKDWQRRVRTWLNQPGRKQRRAHTRKVKAAKIAPRPIDGLLRPAVRCPTLRYNRKLRAGRGFTLEELKTAKIAPALANTIGIAVDYRRRNKSEESLNKNVRRLRIYKSKLVIFRKGKNISLNKKNKDAKLRDLKQQDNTKPLYPVRSGSKLEMPRAIKEEERKPYAFQTLLNKRQDLRQRGTRNKKAKEKAEEEAQKVKK